VQGAGWQQSKSLKQYLQELGVPPWYRDKVPLLFCGRQMAAVADYCICDGFQAPPGEAGATLYWDTGTMPAKP
jgi:tRNA(Ile)-lysidine synthase